MDMCHEVERSIIKKYRKTVWRKFVEGINEYQLISEGDKIAVCISGGKDSFLMAKCFQELQKHGKIKFDLEFIVMNPGYTDANMNKVIDNSKLLSIPIKVFETDIFEIVSSVNEGHPCYLCARMRRGHLYNEAKELGCNKIALGHHYDDVIETILLSMLYGGEIKTMMPKLHSTNFKGMELIRPMYLVKEADILAWQRGNELTFLNCACKFTEKSEGDENGISDSKRLEMKMLVGKFRKTNKHIEQNIFKSVENINLDAVIGYKQEAKEYHFLDDYDNRKEL